MNNLARIPEIAPALPERFADWFAARGWQPHGHQVEMLEAARAGQSALLIAPTGGGKPLAGFLPSLVELAEAPSPGPPAHPSLHTLYVSPLKALAVDIHRNLTEPIADMGLEIACETRTGDTPQSKRIRQRRTPPQILMTTPESLALLLSYHDAARANRLDRLQHQMAGLRPFTPLPCISSLPQDRE